MGEFSMESRDIESFKDRFEEIEQEIKKVIIGQDEIVRNVLIGIIVGGNILLEGSPGLGKTELVKTISKVLDLSFSRIQFTPDLMPMDIIGTTVINKKDHNIDFIFEKGPIFNSIVLADEINRATPKTQSALLEAMQEKTVTVSNETYKLPDPFFVLATQNPLEMEGTYPLPEAQLDRFMMKLNIKMPDVEDICQIVDLTTSDYKKIYTRKLIGKDEIIKMREIAAKIPAAKDVRDYAVTIMMETHPENSQLKTVHDYVSCGVSLRGVQAMLQGAKVKALIEGRYNTAYKDIEFMAYSCLRHRMFLSFRASVDKVSADTIISEIIQKVK
jgi:MoxR-like ATPase